MLYTNNKKIRKTTYYSIYVVSELEGNWMQTRLL